MGDRCTDGIPQRRGGGAIKLTVEGIASLCAVGVRGEAQHSPNEHALPESMLTQAKRLAAAILNLPDMF